LAFPACSISLWRGWKIDRIANSGKSGNGRDRVEGVDGVGSDLIDRKTDRKRVKAMKTNKTEEKAAF
jgi:hypothetical protein